MHYYLLCPVKREVLLTGKYLAGVASVALCFMVSVTASYLMMFHASDSGSLEQFVLMGAGKAHLAAYLGITLLACFRLRGGIPAFRNTFQEPDHPERHCPGPGIHQFSTASGHEKSQRYLLPGVPLCPVPIKESIFSVAARPASWPVAIFRPRPGLGGFPGHLLLEIQEAGNQ